jgi:hypothetical protein
MIQDYDDTDSCVSSSAGYSADAESETLERPIKRRRHKRREVGENTECSWIERIFSSTPYATPLDADEGQIGTPLLIQHPQKPTSPHPEKAKKVTPIPPLLLPILDMLPLNDCTIEKEKSKSGMAGSLMDTLNIYKLDDDVLAWGLVTIVDNLLTDSYRVRATYRSYSLNHEASADAATHHFPQEQQPHRRNEEKATKARLF